MDLGLKGKRAIVTGGNRGIGRCCALALAREGARVCIAARNRELLDKTVGEIHEVAGEGHAVAADLSALESCQEVVNEAVDKLGGVDILVNCAGLQHVEPIETFPVETWNAIIAINLSAIFHTTRLVIPHMRARNWGRIVNIASAHGLVASPYKVPYIASKHGVVGFTKGTALEVGDWGITCNAICPGFVDTPMFQVQAEGLAKTLGVSKEQVIGEQVADKQAIKEVISVEEIAASVAFLCSDAARSITAAAIPVDGGWTAV